MAEVFVDAENEEILGWNPRLECGTNTNIGIISYVLSEAHGSWSGKQTSKSEICFGFIHWTLNQNDGNIHYS